MRRSRRRAAAYDRPFGRRARHRKTELFDAARRGYAWFLRNGTTTIEAKSGYGLSSESELKMLRVIRRLATEGPARCVPTFLGAHEIPDEFRGNPAGYVTLLMNEMLPAVVAEKVG